MVSPSLKSGQVGRTSRAVRVPWDSLPLEVRRRTEASPLYDRGLTEVQAAILETRCWLGLRRVEFARLVGLEGTGARGRSPGITVYRWEAGWSIPRPDTCRRIARLAAGKGLPVELVDRLERMAQGGRSRLRVAD